VELECPEDASPVLADDLIRDLFMNLLSNAVKYTPGNRADIDVRVVDGYSAVTVAICDQGSGIPDSRKGLVFNRFTNRPEGFQGTGLGLSIVSLLVQRYNGLITVKDRVEGDSTKGTCFEVSFPKVAGIASEGMYSRAPAPVAERNK
jgi:signal transduction histidine kinase